ncbi:MAG: glycoside hydrolase family 76 protein [Solirubrobacteraceae bacterium]
MTLPRLAHRRLATAGCLVVLLALLLCAPAAPAATRRHPPKVKKPPALSLYAQRAVLAYEAMQQNFYVPSAGLYKGEPEYSFLWPFSQALAASVSVAHISGQQVKLAGGLRALATGLQVYASAPAPVGETTATGASTTLRSFDGVVAPPVGPGGDSFYDDNEWVGIELVRLYELSHEPAELQQAEQIMEFVMAGWQTAGPEGQPLPCPGGVPFSNAPSNAQRNTVTDGPAAELGVQLYRITHETRYLQFAELAYGWVRQCLLEPSGLYADHINLDGEVNRTLWSYTQGTMMGAGALLYQATHEGAYLYEARLTAKAALAYFTYSRLSSENPFFVSVYFRNLLYLDSIARAGAPPAREATLPAREYAYYAWQRHRLSDDLFAYGSPPTAELLGQAALVQIYALLSTPPKTFF